MRAVSTSKTKPCFNTLLYSLHCKHWRIQDFHWGFGGGRKRLCARKRTSWAWSLKSLTAGSRAHLRALECSLGLIFNHSDFWCSLRGGGGCYLSLILSESFWYKMGFKKWGHSWSNFRGGGYRERVEFSPLLNPPLLSLKYKCDQFTSQMDLFKIFQLLKACENKWYTCKMWWIALWFIVEGIT